MPQEYSHLGEEIRDAFRGGDSSLEGAVPVHVVVVVEWVKPDSTQTLTSLSFNGHGDRTLPPWTVSGLLMRVLGKLSRESGP